MVMTKSRMQGPIGQAAPDIGRFFSETNLDRYQKLANGAVSKAEQYQVLEELAAEMNAFRREARLVAVCWQNLSNENIGPHSGDKI
jgi:hypothetical protein